MSVDAPIRTFRKDPNAKLDYGFDWYAQRLVDKFALTGNREDGPYLDVGESISASTWEVTGDDDALIIEEDENTSTTTTVVLSGGTAGATYYVRNHITTNVADRENDRTIKIVCEER